MTITLNRRSRLTSPYIEMCSVGEYPKYFTSDKNYYFFETENLYIGSFRHKDILNKLNLSNENLE